MEPTHIAGAQNYRPGGAKSQAALESNLSEVTVVFKLQRVDYKAYKQKKTSYIGSQSDTIGLLQTEIPKFSSRA